MTADYWGSWSNHLRVGREKVVRWTTSPGASIYYWVGYDGFDYDDDQRLNYSGDISGGTNFRNNLGGHSHAVHQGSVKDQKYIGRKDVTGNPGETVTVRAQLSGSYNGGTPFEQVSFKLADVPNKPNTPTVSNIGQTSARVNMSLPGQNYSPIENTVLRVWTAATGGSSVTDGVSDKRTVHTFTGLNPGTDYWADCYAINGIGSGPASNRRKFTTKALVGPSKPSLPTISNRADTSVTVTASIPSDNDSNITGHRIQVRRASNNSVVYDITAAATSRTVSNLAVGTGYVARSQAQSDVGPSAWSEYRSFTTTSTLADPPLNPTVTFDNANEEATFSWEPPEYVGGSPITAYAMTIYTNPAGGTGTVVFNTPEDATTSRTVSYDDLLFDTLLWMRIRARNSAGLGEVTIHEFTVAQPGHFYYFNAEEIPDRLKLYYFDSNETPHPVDMFYFDSNDLPVQIA